MCTFGNITELVRNGRLTLVILREDSEYKSFNYINKVSIQQNAESIKRKCRPINKKVQQNDSIGIYIPAECQDNETCPLQIAVASNSSTRLMNHYNHSLGNSSDISNLLNGGVSWMKSDGSYEFNLRIKIKGTQLFSYIAS